MRRRPLTVGDLGLNGDSIDQIDGSICLTNGTMTVRINHIEGAIENHRVFSIVRSLRNLAHENHAAQLTIECTIANERLLDIVTRRYNAVSDGGVDRLTWEIK